MATATQYLQPFDALADLLEAYAIRLNLHGVEDMKIARMVAKTKYTYQPHIYRGGYVIPGFGFSMERIGKWVTAEGAGDPQLVERTR